MNGTTLMSRRDFLTMTAAAGTSLILGMDLASKTVEAQADDQRQEIFVPNAYLRIDADGIVTLIVHRSEMGQGVQTALPMILADELEADWATIRVEQAPADPVYGDQITGGSVSVQTAYCRLRMAAAAARIMLVAAAAQTWVVDPETCRAENSTVVHTPSGQRLGYGQLVNVASTLPVPGRSEIEYKSPEKFRYIGTRRGQIDNPLFVTGSAVFGSDIYLPDMVYAAVARCPVFGGRVTGFDDEQALSIPGVRRVVEISQGVAVIADNTWSALQGRKALDVRWDSGDYSNLESDQIRQMALDKIAARFPPATNGSATVIEALYEAPYLAHATMEPMVCVADVRSDGCDVWVPTQNRQEAKRHTQSITHLPADTIRIHVTLIGGGFGRRLRVDYVDEAVELSRIMGVPVKVFWTREDDLRHDFYRPASYHQVRAGLNADGKPVSWEHYSAAQPIESDSDLNHGIDIPYRIPNKKVRYSSLSLPVPTGYWRSVFNSQNAFVNECFIDELAVASGSDPYMFRMTLLEDSTPIKRVLELAASQAGWGTPLPEGWGRGIACHTTWNTSVAQVVEVSVIDGELKIHRVVCAVDCGLVINPDMVEAQMEGGIVFGLTSALYGEITLSHGQVVQRQFRDYQLMRFDEMPVIEVHIVPDGLCPTGIGEMGNPPVTPALLNAIYAVTGKRIRQLPVRAEALQSGDG
jgi:isoquinoline 1-oxidoreductase beta subunit